MHHQITAILTSPHFLAKSFNWNYSAITFKDAVLSEIKIPGFIHLFSITVMITYYIN